jgi:hypothetical protein
MKKSIKLAPPTWAKNAVPSEQGWRHPKTNELLVAVKLDVASLTKKTTKPKKETKEIKVDPVVIPEIVPEAIPEVVAEEQKGE